MSKYLKHHLKLGNRQLQTCEFSQKLGVSLLLQYIGLHVDVSYSDRKTKIKHPIHRLFRQNHNIIIFEDKNWMKKESVLKCCKMLELGGLFLVGTWFFFAKIVLIDNLFTAWALTGNLFHAIPRHEYIFSNLLKREDRGLSPRKCCINILKRYYTAV